MLRIVVNDQDIDLEGVKFNLQLNSPIPFSPEDGLVEGSFAFGVSFPATAVNKKIFGYPHRLEKYPEAQRDFQGLLYFNGRMLFEIIVSLTDASDRSFKANIKINLGYYTTLIGDKSLRNLLYDGVVEIGESTQDVLDHANAVVSQSYPETSYNFPQVYHPRFYGDEKKMNPTWQERMNMYIHGSGFHPNAIDMGYVVLNYYNLCPWPYLFKVLKHCFSEFGYRITGPVLADQELASLLIYNNYALDLVEDRYKLRAELTSDQPFLDIALIEFDDPVVNIDQVFNSTNKSYKVLVGGKVHIEAGITLEIPDYTELIADYDLWFYLDGVAIGYFSGYVSWEYPEEIKIGFDYLLTDDDIGKEITVKVRIMYEALPYPGTVKTGSWFSAQNIPWSLLNTYAKSINLANHVPDIKISAFLVALQQAFGIVYHFNHSTRDVECMFLKDILNSATEDVYTDLTAKSTKLAGFRETRSYRLDFAWSDKDEYTKENFKPYDSSKLIGTFASADELPLLSIEGNFAILRNINAVYRFETDSWQLFTDLHDHLDVGEGKTLITFDMSPLMMYANYDNPAVPKVYPKILQEGSSFNLGFKDFGFHLMFYRGLRPDSNGNTYPFASLTKYGPTGSTIGNYELILNGSSGIYATFLEAYYKFVKDRSRPVDYDRYFSAAEIRDINFIRKKRIFQHVFLLKEVSVPVSNDSLGIASVKLQKI